VSARSCCSGRSATRTRSGCRAPRGHRRRCRAPPGGRRQPRSHRRIVHGGPRRADVLLVTGGSGRPRTTSRVRGSPARSGSASCGTPRSRGSCGSASARSGVRCRSRTSARRRPGGGAAHHAGARQPRGSRPGDGRAGVCTGTGRSPRNARDDARHDPSRARGRGGPSALASRTVRVTGVAESRVAELLDDLFVGRANPRSHTSRVGER